MSESVSHADRVMSTVPDRPAQVVVIIVHYDGLSDLKRCLESLFATEFSSVLLRVIVVDNQSTSDLQTLLTENFDRVTLLKPSENLGFAGGNNYAWAYAEENFPDTDFVALLNQDTTVADNWAAPLVNFLRQNPKVAAAQPAILLMDEPTKINTLGNGAHYLGFGYISHYREEPSWDELEPREIGFASGCAVMLRVAALRTVGLFDERLFMYCEDTDLGWKIRHAGWTSYVVPQSVVWHDYSPTAPVNNYFYLERNRWLLVLGHYSLWTLLILMPAFIAMECGQWLFALSRGLLWQRIRATASVFRPGFWQHVGARRRLIQNLKKPGASTLLDSLSGTIPAGPVDSAVLQKIANPLFNLWWKLVRRFLV